MPKNYGPQHGAPQPSTGAGRFRRSAKALHGDQRRSQLMPLSPADAAAAALQRQSIKYQNKITKSNLAQEAARIRADSKEQMAQAREEGKTLLGQANTAAVDRGVFGSSVHVDMEEEARKARDDALTEIVRGRTDALQDIVRQRMQAAADKRMGLANVALQQAAARQQASLDTYGGPTRKPGDYALDTSSATMPYGAGGGGTPGDTELFFGGNKFNISSEDADHLKHLHLAIPQGEGKLWKLLRRIDAMTGFQVGENPRYGGVNPVHTDNSWHYKGRAADINYTGGGEFGSEQEALSWLEHFLYRKLYLNAQNPTRQRSKPQGEPASTRPTGTAGGPA